MDLDDDLWRLKMGRFSDAEEMLYARLLCLGRPRCESLSSRALAWRSRHVDGGWRLNRGPQAVVKAAGSRKSQAGVRACLRYVARLRQDDHDLVPLFDEFGRKLAGDQIFKVLDGWGLEPDADNLSAVARWGGETDLPERRRLRTVQAWHFVFSIKAEPDNDVSEPLIRAAGATVDSLFTRQGYRVIWALHRDHPDRPHIHVVVKAVSETGDRLRCDIHGDLFDTMRSEFAANLSAVGLPFQAARREDRSERRSQVMQGQVPLRPWRDRRAGRGDLVRRAPSWFARFGEDYVARLKRKGDPPARESLLDRLWRRLAPNPPPVPVGMAEVFPLFQMVYRHPHRAMESWRCLARDGTHAASTRRLAEWYVRCRPEAFGEPLPGIRPNGDLAFQLRKVVLPSLETAPMALSPNPALVEELARIRWRRRVDRDRRRVVGSLIRLAGIVRIRLGDEALTLRLLRRALTAMEIAVGPMPRPERTHVTRPLLGPANASGGGGARLASEPLPIHRPETPVPSLLSPRSPKRLPPPRGRGGAER